jgi:tRNA-dihydrouridine synthase
MAGVSESPFRRLCRKHGADVVVTEFLSAEGIRRENQATLSKLRFGPDERTIGVQIFGADPTAMAEAAALVTDVFQPEFVDINFGCPVKKVVRRNGGSGCLKDLGLVEEIIRSVVRSTHLPVTVKTRSGWSEETRDPVGIARRMQDAGTSQVIRATHSPILMALPDARLLRLEKYGLRPVALEDTDHYRMMREFILDPHGTVDTMIWS